ncbi:CdaR family transcriptional regulator [Pseudonocardia sp. MH-G8]|uniref:PucR family transcriptional regulator n=1 Tax=Pseudonocardia sp. MH-G8 TaxID=1854588 RepID=UPI000BD6488D|nr:helix-turn-helix domain-containing protein [Pseudonocardia sp. MH-G8]OZM76497.1 CdaR family transcriptional regulator [Pseudonocardia sp. MH-G8]
MQHADRMLQDIVDSLAARLERSVAIDDPQIKLLAASRHFGDEDRARIESVLHREVGPENVRYVMSHGISGWHEPGWMPPDDALGVHGRICAPVRCHGLLLGYLWLIDPDGSAFEGDLAPVTRAAEAAGVVLYRSLMLHEQQQRRAADLLLDLLSADGERRAHAAVVARDERLLTEPGPVVVLAAALEGDSPELEVLLSAAAEYAVRPLPAGAALVRVAGAGLTLLLSAAALDAEVSAVEVAERLVARVGELAGEDVGCAVGVGSAGPDLAHALASYRHATSAQRVARAVAGAGPVAVWDRLGAYSLLARLGPEDLTPQSCPAPVARLLADGRSAHLLETLETYLDHAGDAARTAAALRIHRTTLYYRLGRAEQVAGIDLRDGADRLTVHLGVKLARLAGWIDDAGAFRQM